MSKTFFRKIIPPILIIAIFATGFFGVFGVDIVNALTDPRYSKEPESELQPGSSLDVSIKRANELSKVPDIGNSITGCDFRGLLNPYNCIRTILANIAQAILEFLGFFVWVSGKLLNVAVDKTVLEMGASFQSSSALGAIVKEAWKTIRDLSNIIIIFTLLAIGIGTILGIEKYSFKKLLGKLIVVAILINFSLFFTNVIIDSSNLLALQFYNNIKNDEKININKNENISDYYMQAFKLSTFYSNNTYDDSGMDFSQAFVQNGGSIKNIFIIAIFGSIMFLITAFSFLATAFLLISRYVVFVFLMILSPIYFVGMILPAMNQYSQKWMDTLLKNAVYAPAYFLLTWFVIKIINSPAYQASLDLFGKEKFSDLVNTQSFSSDSIGLIFNFIIVIFFIIMTILLSHQMGIKGSGMIIKWGQSAKNWGQGMVGGLATRPIRRGGTFIKTQGGNLAEKMQKSEHSFAKGLRYVPGVVGALGAFGAKGRGALKKREELYQDKSDATLENLLKSKLTSIADKKAISQTMFDKNRGNPEKQAKIFYDNLDENQQKVTYLSLSPVNRYAFEEKLKDNDKDKDGKLIKKLREQLSKEDEEKTKDAAKAGALKAVSEKISDAMKKGKPDEVKEEVRRAREDNTLHKWSKETLMKADVFEHFTNDDFDIITRLGPLNFDDKRYMYEKAEKMKNPPIFFNTPVGKKLWGGKKEKESTKDKKSKIITDINEYTDVNKYK